MYTLKSLLIHIYATKFLKNHIYAPENNVQIVKDRLDIYEVNEDSRVNLWR